MHCCVANCPTQFTALHDPPLWRITLFQAPVDVFMHCWRLFGTLSSKVGRSVARYEKASRRVVLRLLVDCYIASYTPLNLVQDDEDLSWHYEDVVDSTKPTIDQLVQCLTAYSEDRSPSMWTSLWPCSIKIAWRTFVLKAALVGLGIMGEVTHSFSTQRDVHDLIAREG